MKTLFSTIYYFLIAGMVLVALLLASSFLPIPGNFKIKVVKSGSMEPAIKTGSIVAIVPESTYKVGDVITFGADTKTQIPTTHRIVNISGGPNPVYTTKGDANDAADQADTHLSDIHGRVIFTVPLLGYVLDFARRPVGFFLLVGVPALAIILEEIANIVREVRVMKKRSRAQVPGVPSRLQKNDYVPQQTTNYRNTLDLRSL